jgi:hypothetical protein
MSGGKSGLRSISCALAAGVLLAMGASVVVASPPVAPAPVPPGAMVLDQFAQTFATLPNVDVATYGGWIAWSHPDPASGGYELMLRSPAGQVAAAGVSERASAFDVTLGPTPAGGVAATYSRCNNATYNTGCRIVELPLGTGGPAREVTLHPPGGGSLHSPAIWGHQLAFLRVHPGGGVNHPDDRFEWTIGSRHLQAFRLPRNHYAPADIKADPTLKQTQDTTGQITALSLHGSRVAYTRVAQITNPIATSDLWIQSPGGPPQLIDRDVTGGAASGIRTYLNPTISGTWIYAFRQYTDQGYSFVRYSLVQDTAQQATVAFGQSREYGNVVLSAVRYETGVVWAIGPEVDNGLTRILLEPSITWHTIPRPRVHPIRGY